MVVAIPAVVDLPFGPVIAPWLANSAAQPQLHGFRIRYAIRRTLHESDHPCDIVHPDLGMPSLKFESGLGSAEKRAHFLIGHDPLTAFR